MHTPKSPSALTPATVSRALSVINALAVSNWGSSMEALMWTYKAIVSLILNYAAHIWFTEVCSSHLEVIQNKFLRIATGCHQKDMVSHLRGETGVLPLRAHLGLCSQQFYACALQPSHPSHFIVTIPHPPTLLGLLFRLQVSYNKIFRGLRENSDEPNAPIVIFGGVLGEGNDPLARSLLLVRMIGVTVRSYVANKVLLAPPPPMDFSLITSGQLSSSSNHSARLQLYRYSIGCERTGSDNACVRPCRVKLSFRKFNGNCRKCAHRTRACDKRQKQQATKF